MARGLLLGGLPNAAFLPGSAAYGSAQVDGDNILTADPTERAAVTRLLPPDLYFACRSNYSFIPAVFALVATNAGGDLGVWRLRYSSNLTTWDSPSYTRATPDGSSGAVNLTGSHTNIDDIPDTPDGLVIGPTTTTSPWSVRITFGTPASTPIAGAYRQTFCALALRNGTGSRAPTLEALLYEGGVLRRSLGTKSVTRSGGQWLQWHWDISELSNTTGANAEVMLVGTPLQDGALAWSYCSVDCLTWYGDNAATPGTATAWMPVPRLDSDSNWGGASADLIAPGPQRMLLWVPPSGSITTPARQWVFDVKDDLVRGEATAPANLEAGVSVMGAGHAFSSSSTYEAKFEIRRGTMGGGTTVSGAPFGVTLYQQRTMQLELVLPDSEWQELQDRAIWRAAGSTPMLVVLLPDEAQPLFRALYATIPDASWGYYEGSGAEMVRATVTVEERV